MAAGFCVYLTFLPTLFRVIHSQCATTTLWSPICYPGVTATLPTTLPVCDIVAYDSFPLVNQYPRSVAREFTASLGSFVSGPGPQINNIESSSRATMVGFASEGLNGAMLSVSNDLRAGGAGEPGQTGVAQMVMSTVPENKTASLPYLAISPTISPANLTTSAEAGLISEISQSMSIRAGFASDDIDTRSLSVAIVQTGSQIITSIGNTEVATLASKITMTSSSESQQSLTIVEVMSSPPSISTPDAVSQTVMDVNSATSAASILSRVLILSSDGRYFNRLGKLQIDCTTSTLFAIDSDGRLTPTNDLNDVVSADIGTPFEPLSLYKPGRAIQSSWTNQGSVLSWKSSAFSNDAAIFCQGADNIIAYYQEAPPSDCKKAQLSIQDPSDCPNYVGDNKAGGSSKFQASDFTSTIVPTQPLLTVPSVLVVPTTTN